MPPRRSQQEIEAVKRKWPDPQAGSRMRRSRGSFSDAGVHRLVDERRGTRRARRGTSSPCISSHRRPSVLSTRNCTTYRGVKNWLRTASSRLLPAAWLSPPHLLCVFVRVEELVDPPDCLVLAPDHCQFRRIQDRKQPLESLPLWPEDGRGIPPVEQDLDLGRKLVEQALNVEPIACGIGEQREPRRHPAEFPVARGLLALRDAFLHELPRFQHLERDEAIQRREGRIAHIVCDCLLGSHPGGALVLDRRDDFSR